MNKTGVVKHPRRPVAISRAAALKGWRVRRQLSRERGPWDMALRTELLSLLAGSPGRRLSGAELNAMIARPRSSVSTVRDCLMRMQRDGARDPSKPQVRSHKGPGGGYWIEP